MTASTISEIASRIKSAPVDSPIALFSCPNPGKLECVFARTFKTLEMINKTDKHRFIGMYHGGMDQAMAMLDYSKFVK